MTKIMLQISDDKLVVEIIIITKALILHGMCLNNLVPRVSLLPFLGPAPRKGRRETLGTRLVSKREVEGRVGIPISFQNPPINA